MASAQNWLILVYQPDGSTLRQGYAWTTSTLTYVTAGPSGLSPYTSTVTPTYAYVEQIDWTVEPSGNCLAASFIGDSHGLVLNIHPRDVVVLCTLGYLTGETTTYYYPRFRGVAKTPANPLRSDGQPHAYALDGMYKVCNYIRTPVNKNYASGTDIGALLVNWAQDMYGAGSSASAYSDGGAYTASAYTLTGNVASMYVVGSTLGVTNQAAVNPGAASLGQYLDKLAQLATSAGTTTVWGVDRYGGIFIKAKGSTNVSLTESDPTKQTVVAYPDVQAQEVIERIQWVIADGDADQNLAYGTGDKYTLDTPDTLTHSTALNDSTWEDMTAPKQIPSGVNVYKPLDVTLDIGTTPPAGASWVGGTRDLWALAADTPAGDYSSTGIAVATTGIAASTPPTTPNVTNDIPVGAIITFPWSGYTSNAYLKLTTAATAGDTTVYGIVYNGTLPGLPSMAGTGNSIVQTRFLEADPIAYVVLYTDSNLASSVVLTMPSGTASTDVAKVQAHLQLDSSSPNIVSGTEGQFRYYFEVRSTGTPIGTAYQDHSLLTGGSPQSVNKGFVFGDRSRSADTTGYTPTVTRLRLILDFVNGSYGAGQAPLQYDLQDFRVFGLDTALLDTLAEQEYKAPKLNVVAVTVKGEEAPADTLSLTLASGAFLEAVSIDRFEYSIYGKPQPGPIPKGGVRTTIHTGERGLPQDMYLVNAIKKQARSAVLHAKGAA